MTSRVLAWTVGCLLCAGLPAAAQESWPEAEPAPDTRDPGKAPDPGVIPDMPAPEASPPGKARKAKKKKKPRKPDPDLSTTTLSLWTGIGSWTISSSDHDEEKSGRTFQYSVGIDARIGFGDSIPLGAVLNYELHLGLVGVEDTEVDVTAAPDLEYDNEITNASHLLDAGLCGVFVISKKHFVLFPFAAYTFYAEGIDRRDFDLEKGPPAALAGLDEVKDRISGHGFSVGVQASVRFFRFFGMDANISYSFIATTIDRTEGPGERAGNLSTETHMLRIVPRIWFEVIPEVLTVGTRGGIGLRYIDGEDTTRNLGGPLGSTTFDFPNTFISSSLLAVELRLLF